MARTADVFELINEPSPPSPSPLRARGRLHLAFAATAGGSTHVTVLAQAAPLKIIRAFAHGPHAALVHLHNTAGGLLGGDHLATEVTLGPRSHAVLTTTSATRIYRQKAGDLAAVQSLSGSLAARAQLEYLPDPTIPYAASAYSQSQRWDLAEGARLLTWEVLLPGRTVYEKPWSLAHYSSRLGIYVEGRPVLLEAYTLAGGTQYLADLARYGQNTHLGSFCLCDSAISSADWRQLARQLDDYLHELRCSDKHSTLVHGVSTLAAHGLAVRLLDCSTDRILLACERLRRLVKAQLWQQDDPLPRKIY